eukprot:m.305530 g.305530  ORF g.305530 m.305530 type:complete len:100 (+) comp16341_c0_seq2:59-358(+)
MLSFTTTYTREVGQSESVIKRCKFTEACNPCVSPPTRPLSYLAAPAFTRRNFRFDVSQVCGCCWVSDTTMGQRSAADPAQSQPTSFLGGRHCKRPSWGT